MYNLKFLSNNNDTAVLVTSDDVVQIPDDVQNIDASDNQIDSPQADNADVSVADTDTSTGTDTADLDNSQDSDNVQNSQDSQTQNSDSESPQNVESEPTVDTPVPSYTLDDIYTILADIDKNQDTLIDLETSIRNYQKDSIVLQKFANTSLLVLIFAIALLSGLLFARIVFRKL